MDPLFSIEESLSFGWAKTKEHSGLIFKSLLTLFAVQIAYMIVEKVLVGTLMGILGQIALTFAEFVVGVGLTLITLRIAQGKHVEFKDIIPPVDVLWRYFVASLVAGLIIIIGFVCFIIPGIYFTLRLSMYRFAVLDGAGIMESLSKSSVATRGVRWHLLGFFLVAVLINILGAILLLVGLLVTIPVTAIAYAHIYQKLSHHRSHSA